MLGVGPGWDNQQKGPLCCGVNPKSWELLSFVIPEVPSTLPCPKHFVSPLGKDVTLGSCFPWGLDPPISVIFNILTNGCIPRLVPRNTLGEFCLFIHQNTSSNCFGKQILPWG